MKSIEELLEIVDEDNNLLGVQKKRGIVHNIDCQDWHRTTSVWIINDKQEILCQKSNPIIKPEQADKWYSIFGGHIVVGQTEIISALCELQEEIGLEINEGDLIFLGLRKSSQKHRHFIYTYGLIWNGDIKDLKFNDNEVVEVMWVSYEELKKMEVNDLLNNSIPEIVKIFISKNLIH